MRQREGNDSLADLRLSWSATCKVPSTIPRNGHPQLLLLIRLASLLFFFGGLSGTRSRRHLYLVRPPHPPTPSDSSGSRLRKRGFTTIRIQNFRYLDRLRIFPSIHKSNRKSAVTSSHAAICTRGRFHLSVATLTILSFHRC